MNRAISALLHISQIDQLIATLVLTGIAAILIWGVAMIKHGDCDIRKLGRFALDVVGVISGVFIFFGSFSLIKTSAQNGLVSGIGGIIITLGTLTDLIKELRAMFGKEVRPVKIQGGNGHTK
jgi:hypothetical protein